MFVGSSMEHVLKRQMEMDWVNCDRCLQCDKEGSPAETPVFRKILRWEGNRFCLSKKIFPKFLERKADQAFRGECGPQTGLSKHSLNWTDENGRCRVLTELSMNRVSNFIPRGWNFIKRIS